MSIIRYKSSLGSRNFIVLSNLLGVIRILRCRLVHGSLLLNVLELLLAGLGGGIDDLLLKAEDAGLEGRIRQLKCNKKRTKSS